MTLLFAAIQKFRDAPGAGVKTEYVLGTAPGGGGGMDFAVGTETFQWNSQSIPSSVKPRHLVSLSVDTTGLSAAGVLTITINGKKYAVNAGVVGYTIITQQAPLTMTFSSAGATGTVNVSVYDYNALFTGTGGNTSAVGPAGQGGGGVSGGGGGAPFGGSDIGPFGTDGFGPL